LRQNLFGSDVVAVNLAARVQFRGDVRSILKDYVQRNMCRTDHRAVKNIELSPVQEPSIVNSQETLRRPIGVEDVSQVCPRDMYGAREKDSDRGFSASLHSRPPFVHHQ